MTEGGRVLNFISFNFKLKNTGIYCTSKGPVWIVAGSRSCGFSLLSGTFCFSHFWPVRKLVLSKYSSPPSHAFFLPKSPTLSSLFEHHFCSRKSFLAFGLWHLLDPCTCLRPRTSLYRPHHNLLKQLFFLRSCSVVAVM